MNATSTFFFFSSRRRHTRYIGDWSSDVCSSDLGFPATSAFDDARCDATKRDITHNNEAAMVPTARVAIGSRSEERREGKSVDLGGRRITKKKREEKKKECIGHRKKANYVKTTVQ